jgi:hypothetical protein
MELDAGDEMKLLTALGAALLYGRGPLPKTDDVWSKALQIPSAPATASTSCGRSGA